MNGFLPASEKNELIVIEHTNHKRHKLPPCHHIFFHLIHDKQNINLKFTSLEVIMETATAAWLKIHSSYCVNEKTGGSAAAT